MRALVILVLAFFFQLALGLVILHQWTEIQLLFITFLAPLFCGIFTSLFFLPRSYYLIPSLGKQEP